MKRQVSLEEISDGKLYGRNDMVRADCGGCRGCAVCCSGMGNSVILDPFDICRLTDGLSCTFEDLMKDKIELNVVDGVILPSLKMAGEDERCAFLNDAGRCSIHPLRPGICRLFPLGRYYPPSGPGRSDAEPGCPDSGRPGTSAHDARGFRYFLQVHECPFPHKTKVKVSRWIDTPDLNRYEKFVNDWHYFLEAVQERLERGSKADRETGRGDDPDEEIRRINLLLLKLFYLRPYRREMFYEQFAERLAMAEEALELS